MFKKTNNLLNVITSIGVFFILGCVVFLGIYTWDTHGQPEKAVKFIEAQGNGANKDFIKANFLDDKDGEKNGNDVSNILTVMKGTDVVATVTMLNKEVKTYDKNNYYIRGGINEIKFVANQRFNCYFSRTKGIIDKVEIVQIQ